MKKKTYNRRTKEPVQGNLLKPRLILVGNHLINPLDVSRISKVKVREREEQDQEDGSFFNRERATTKHMYIVKFISDPNPAYPCWVDMRDAPILLEQFDIVEAD